MHRWEQTAIAATPFQREAGDEWIASVHTDAALILSGINVALPLAELYRSPTFAA